MPLRHSSCRSASIVNEDGEMSSTNTRRNSNQMKKLMTVLLGLSLVLGTASVTFAQQDTTKKTGKKGKKSGKKTDTTKSTSR